jgi:hypothetical protein
MRCERYEQDLTAGAAGRTITGDLEAHLEECVACRQRLAAKRALLEAVDQVLRVDVDVEPSPALRHRVISRVAQKERERRRMMPGVAAAALAAVLVIVLFAGAWAHRRSTTPLESSAAVISPRPPVRDALVPEAPETLPIPSTPRLVTGTPHAVGSDWRPAATREAFVREPEVLVPPGQEAALRRFVAVLRDGSTLPPPLLLTGASLESLIVPVPLMEIPMLEAKPLADSVDSAERSPS